MSVASSRFTVCMLFYGNYPDLAQRCAGSVAAVTSATMDIRIGLNKVCDRTRDIVLAAFPTAGVWEAEENARKYPMMRRMLYDADYPLQPNVMWFDDDSYIDVTTALSYDWWTRIDDALRHSAMIGSKYGIPLTSKQREFIREQPWYKGKEVQKRAFFVTGGWWVAKSAVLTKLDYPWKYLDHRGGDVMLGEAMRQAGEALGQFRECVHINADEYGRESKSRPRGLSPTQKPIGSTDGSDYPPPAAIQIIQQGQGRIDGN